MHVIGAAGLFRHHRPPPGSRPGEIRLPDDALPTVIRAVSYSEQQFEEAEISDVGGLTAQVARAGVTWIDVEGLGDGAVLGWLRDEMGVHPLAVADIAHAPQRPKFENYGAHVLVIAQRAAFDEGDGCTLHQVSIVTGANWVVTVQERPSPLLDPLRERIRTGALIRRMGPDYLVYSVLDSVIDGYFPVLETVGEVLDDLEEVILDRPGRDAVNQLHAARRLLLALHRSMWRLRDAVGQMLRSDGGHFGESVRLYARDAHDHSMQVLDAIESYREMTVGLMDLYLSNVALRSNETMRTLTVVATIFIPLTFIAGVYGMNFQYMPELGWRWGYGGVWALMIAVAAGLLVWFQRRGWLEATDRVAVAEEESGERNLRG